MINGTVPGNKNTIGLIPNGSGNDFSRNIYPGFNLTSFLEKLFSGNIHVKNIDLGKASIVESDSNSKEFKFINSLGAGFDADVAYNVKR